MALDRLIPVVNKLQDVISTAGTTQIQLPQIAVIGGQSAGKSSVLENIVGKTFLPRGTGIVTRRPLILKLVHTGSQQVRERSDGDNKENEVGEEWGEFLHMQGKRIYDFGEIQKEIEAETDRTCEGMAISDEPINLTVYSPKVLNLTMIDLPGMTKNAVKGQPKDIGAQIKKLLLKYVAQPETLILAVGAANSDIATWDSIHLAREVDPEGQRTLGVVTKLDIMDQGTHALDILQGKVYPLKLGYIGVLNRSQKDILENASMDATRQKEQQFFQTHPAYRAIASKHGTAYLARTLNQILINHIRDSLPTLRVTIQNAQQEASKELTQYGDPIVSGVENQGALLLHLITAMSDNFRKAIDGTGAAELILGRKDKDDELYGGARISYIFHTVFAQQLRHITPFLDLKDREIRTAIRNAQGSRPCLFVPEISFELLVKRQIEKLKHPALCCVEMVFEELQKVATQCETAQLQRFQKLRGELSRVVNGMLRKHLGPTKKHVDMLIDIELAYINTNHPDFISGSKAVSSTLSKQQREQQLEAQQQREAAQRQKAKQEKDRQLKEERDSGFLGGLFGGRKKASRHEEQKSIARRPQGYSASSSRIPNKLKDEPSDREKVETKIIKVLIESYFNLVKKNIQDSVPKTIMHLLVNAAKTEIQQQLVVSLYKQNQFEELLQEDSGIAGKRQLCKKLLATLNKALEILNEVRDFKLDTT